MYHYLWETEQRKRKKKRKNRLSDCCKQYLDDVEANYLNLFYVYIEEKEEKILATFSFGWYMM
jgi:hypothetical protein